MNSKTAFSSLIANIDTCHKDILKVWKVRVEKAKYSPIGEDLIAEMCMRKNGTWIKQNKSKAMCVRTCELTQD